MFPMIFPQNLIAAFIQQALISYINMILIFRVGKKVFLNEDIAELASYLYTLSLSLVYQLSFYSENTFVLFSLLGFYFIGTQSHKVIAAAFFFGLCSLTRTTGVLLSVYIAY